MTNKVYEFNPYLTRYQTYLSSCQQVKEGWHAIMVDTIFFARGGGQPCERGTIGGVEVLDVWDENGIVIHLLAQPVPVGLVDCVIDREMRHEHMRQHLGEHIFSAIIARDYGAKLNILRIEEESSHIEIDRVLTPEQLVSAQKETRKIINMGLYVCAYKRTPQEAAEVLPAHKIEGHDHIRIVEIQGFDITPCGGTHCRSTREVMDFLICGTKEVRGQFRIYFKCGNRAVEEERRRTLDLLALQPAFGVEETRDLSDKVLAVLARKNRLEEQCALQKAALVDLDMRLMVAEGKPLGDWLLICRRMEGDIKHIKEVTTRLCLQHKAIVLVAVIHGEQAGILLARSKGKEGPDMGALFRQLTEVCGGRGGGSVILAQGTIPLDGLPAFDAMAAKIRQD